MEALDLSNVIEIESIKNKITKEEKIIFEYIIKLANVRINNKGLDRPCPIEIEKQIEPILSDHSSDEEYQFIVDSESD